MTLRLIKLAQYPIKVGRGASETKTMTNPLKPTNSLFNDLRALIIEARQDVARQVNSALVLLYWRVGKRIRQDILKEKRAEYG